MIGPLLDDGGDESAHVVTIGGSDPYGFRGAQGAISPTTYVSRDGSTRTITGVQYNVGTGNFIFNLSGTVANNDNAFAAIIIGGVRFARGDAVYGTPSDSQWSWAYGANVVGTSGTVAVLVQR